MKALSIIGNLWLAIQPWDGVPSQCGHAVSSGGWCGKASTVGFYCPEHSESLARRLRFWWRVWVRA